MARGAYLVEVIDCGGCHTPWVMGPEGPQPDMTRFLSGHPSEMPMPPPPPLPPDAPWNWAGAASNTAFAGPWGISYASNLTPDPSGMGAWTEQIFVDTLRSGRHWGQSRTILPPMPWPGYSRMTDEDLKAVFAYLRTIPPVANVVPDAVLAEPPGGDAPAAVGQ